MTETTTPETTEAAPTVERIAPAEIRRIREELGCSRGALAELTGLPTSRIWAAEQEAKTISDEHYAIIIAAFDNVRQNGLPEHLRPRLAVVRMSRAEVKEALVQLNELLGTAHDLKTVKEIRVVIEQAQSSLTELTVSS